VGAGPVEVTSAPDLRQRRVRLRLRRIDGERTRRRGFGDVVGALRRRQVVLGGRDARTRERAVRVGELRVERDRLLVEREAFAEAVRARAVPVIAALEK